MSLKNLNIATNTNEVAYTQAGTQFTLDGGKGFLLQTVATVTTPAAASFETSDVDVDEDAITEASHGFATGLVGQFTTTTTLPSGISTSTDYYIIVVDEDTYQIATSLSNALAGTQVDITDVGTGTHTFTPTALASASVKLQKSIDGVTWFDISSTSNNVTATASIELLEAVDPMYRYVRTYYAMDSGQVSYADTIIIKGEQPV